MRKQGSAEADRRAFRWRIIRRIKTGSTNDLARRLIRCNSIQPWTAIVADRQTGGRGRGNRGWLTLPGSLAVTCVIPPPPPEQPLLPVMIAALSAVDAIRELTGIKAGIKLINDIYVEQRKVGGILAEAPRGLSFPCMVGTGINLTGSANLCLPGPIRHIADVIKADRDEMLGLYLERMCEYIDRAQAGEADKIFEIWRHTLIKLDKPLTIKTPEGSITGVFQEVGPDWVVSIKCDNMIQKADLRHCEI